MIVKFLLLVCITTSLFAKYTNCEFKNEQYIDICQKVIKKGVSYDYANRFLLSYFKTQKFDDISWKYLQPKYIKVHNSNEKKANNTLIKYIPKIVKHLKKYKDVYDYSEKKFGVNREIVASILMKETKLGEIKPKHDAFIVFNTIVTRIDSKTKRDNWLLTMGKTNMVSIIDFCYKKKIKPISCNLPSSYAGAIGIPQFMPNSFIFAEGYKTKIADLTDMKDSIVSVSKFLNKKAKFTKLIDWNKLKNIKTIESEWYQFEFSKKNTSFLYKSRKNGDKYNCFACNKKELNYLKSYLKKILRYNNSSTYAIGVLRLAYESNKLNK